MMTTDPKLTPLQEIRVMVDKQAEDEGLWFDHETASESYLQFHLRCLHALIEHHTQGTDVRIWGEE